MPCSRPSVNAPWIASSRFRATLPVREIRLHQEAHVFHVEAAHGACHPHAVGELAMRDLIRPALELRLRECVVVDKDSEVSTRLCDQAFAGLGMGVSRREVTFKQG
jgi:hypothetical protein